MIRTPEEESYLDGIRRVAAGRALSALLQVAFELDLFGKIKGRSVTVQELADILGMHPSSARLAGQALCKEGILLYQDGKLSNHPVVDKFLGTDNLSRREFNIIWKYTWPIEEMRERLMTPRTTHAYQDRPDEVFYYGFNPRRIGWGEELTLIYDFSPHKVILDVAGSSGGFLVGIRKHNPHLRGMLFDLPKSEPFAKKVFADAGMSDDISFHGGSFLTDELPRGADVILTANVMHNWSPETDAMILRKMYDALEPGGALLVYEFFFEDDWHGTMEAVFQAFILSGDGWQPAYGELEPLMAGAGFVDLERRRPNLLIGRKKA
jgi:SAM-dependent methyltransferase